MNVQRVHVQRDLLIHWVKATPPANSDRHSARGAVLLPGEAGVRREAGRPDLRHGHHVTGSAQPVAHGRGSERGHLRLHKVTIERMDWAACIERYDRSHTLFYLDPPYWGTERYDVAFGLKQYDRMAQLLRSMKGKAVVSVNDIPAMRTAFDGLRRWPWRLLDNVGDDPGFGINEETPAKKASC